MGGMKHSAFEFVTKRAYLLVLLCCLFASIWASGIVPAIIPAAAPTANKTGTGSRFATATAAGVSGNCAQWSAAGDIGDAGAACGSGGSVAFSALTGGTNTAAAMVVGTGASLATSGTGTNFANGIRAYTVGTLPGSPSTGQQAYVTDGTNVFDCVTGGGGIKLLCGYSGSAWSAESGGGAGSFLSGTTDPGAPALPTVVQARATSVGVGGGTNTTLAFSSNVTSGNVVVIGAQCQNAAISSVSDSLSTSYTLVDVNSNGNGGGSTYIGTLASSGGDTITANGTGGCANLSIAISEVHGANGVVDVHAKTSATTGPPSVTTTAAADLLILVTAVGNNSASFTATLPSVVDANATSGNAIFIGHQPANSIGAYTPSVTNGAGNFQSSFTIALEAPGVTSPGVPGSFYVNTTTGVLWGPKTTGGVWNQAGVSFASTTGANGQFLLGGTAPQMGTCGSSPSLSASSSNSAGTITVGSGSVTSCTLDFGTNFTAAPACTAIDDSTSLFLDVSAVSTSAVTFSLASSGITHIYYHCF